MSEFIQSIPIKDMFPEGNLAPEYRPLVEWQISGGRGGKDGKGAIFTYNWQRDALEFPPSVFLERAADVIARSSVEEDPFQLKQLPDEPLYRSYLEGAADFNLEEGSLKYKSATRRRVA